MKRRDQLQCKWTPIDKAWGLPCRPRHEMHCHTSRNKFCQAAMLSAESCFTVKVFEPEPKLDCDLQAQGESISIRKKMV